MRSVNNLYIWINIESNQKEIWQSTETEIEMDWCVFSLSSILNPIQFSISECLNDNRSTSVDASNRTKFHIRSKKKTCRRSNILCQHCVSLPLWLLYFYLIKLFNVRVWFSLHHLAHNTNILWLISIMYIMWMCIWMVSYLSHLYCRKMDHM